jgi:hypothetical protein
MNTNAVSLPFAPDSRRRRQSVLQRSRGHQAEPAWPAAGNPERAGCDHSSPYRTIGSHHRVCQKPQPIPCATATVCREGTPPSQHDQQTAWSCCNAQATPRPVCLSISHVALLVEGAYDQAADCLLSEPPMLLPEHGFAETGPTTAV